MSSLFNCPHCNGPIKAIGQNKRNRRRHAFESTAPRPASWLRYVLFGGDKPDASDAISLNYQPDPVAPIKVELWHQDRSTVHLTELDERITLAHLQAVAQVAMVDGVKWSRQRITRAAGISQTIHNLIQEDFKRLQFLTVSDNNQSALTSPGRRFLRGILQTR